MDEVRKTYVEINKKVFRLRDGELREIQQKYGAVYKKSLGVPLISLEDIASEYKASHEVAKLLWDFGGREQTLLAAMLEEPQKINVEMLAPYLVKAITSEFYEQITFRLLRKLQNPEEIIRKWLKMEAEALHIYAILLLGYSPFVVDESIINLIQNSSIPKHSYKEKVVYRVLLKVGLFSESNKELLRKVLKDKEEYQDLLGELSEF